MGVTSNYLTNESRLAEISAASNAALQTYTWGLDLSGSAEGAKRGQFLLLREQKGVSERKGVSSCY